MKLGEESPCGQDDSSRLDAVSAERRSPAGRRTREPPKPGLGMSMGRCLDAIAAAPLRPKMTWDVLKDLNREP